MSATSPYSLDLFTVGETGWGPSASANFTTINDELARPRHPYNTPAVGGTTTLDLSLAHVFNVVVDEITTIAFSNVPANTWAVPVRCIITNGGAFAVTWPASVTWTRGAAPVLKASGVDVIELVTRDGGTTWYGEGTFPRFRAFRDSSDQSISDATDTTVDFQTEQYDVGGCFATATDRFTVPAGGDQGCWLLHAQVRWTNNATGTRRLWILKNGTTIVAEATQPASNAIEHNQEVALHVNAPLVGDYFEVLCRQTSGAPLNIRNSTVAAYTYFEGARVS